MPPDRSCSRPVAEPGLERTRAVAIAARPSPRPVRPSPSLVVADTDTGAPSSGRPACRPRPRLRRSVRSAAGCRSPGRRRCRSRSRRRAPGRGGLGEQGPAAPGAPGSTPAPTYREVASRGRRARHAESSASQAACSSDVRVGVTLEALRLVGPVQARELHRDAVGEAVDVGADADAGELLHAMIMPGPRIEWVSELPRSRTGRRPELIAGFAGPGTASYCVGDGDHDHAALARGRGRPAGDSG